MRRLAILALIGCTSEIAPVDSGVDAGVADTGDAIEDAGTASLCDPAFDDSSACGGDPIGVWQFLELCGKSEPAKDLEMDCPQARIEEMHSGRGRLRIAAAGTYDFEIGDDFDVSAVLPFSCVENVGGCDGFAALVTLASGVAVSCVTGTAECTCTGSGTQSETSTGTWSAMNGTLTATKASGGVDRFWYCIEGDRATLREIGKDLVFVVER